MNIPTLRGWLTFSYGWLYLLVCPSVSIKRTSCLPSRSPPSAVNSLSPAILIALSVKVLLPSFSVRCKMSVIINGFCLSASLKLSSIVGWILYTMSARWGPLGAIFIAFTRANTNSLEMLKLDFPTLFVASRITPRSMAHLMGPENEWNGTTDLEKMTTVSVEWPHCLSFSMPRLANRIFGDFRLKIFLRTFLHVPLAK